MTISAVIITRNEERRIATCLSSLQGVVDEIVVIDSGSTDKTEEICKKHGAHFEFREWEGYSSAKNYGNEIAASDYILSIDADEALSQELRASLLAIKDKLRGAYSFSRLTSYCGKWIRHGAWYPDIKIRLFAKGVANWQGSVHEKLVLQDPTQLTKLKGDLLHYSIESISDQIAKINQYSTIMADQMFAKGKKASWVKLLLSPIARFIRMYLVQGGFRDGFLGFVIARNSAFSTFLRYAKLRQLYRKEAANNTKT